MMKNKIKQVMVTLLSVMMVLPSFTPLTVNAASSVEITNFSANISAGAEKTGDDWVWTADTYKDGHAYTYRVNYAFSGAHEYEPGDIVITVPKQLLKDRDGNYADTYDVGVPEVGDPEIGENTEFVFEVSGDDIIISNVKQLPAAQNGFIEIAYVTTENAQAYKDYGSSGSGSDDFTADISVTQNGDTKTAHATAPKVYMNTGADIRSTEKKMPKQYKKWQNSWGTEVKPSDHEDYWYLVWEVRTKIEPTTQPYNFSIEDVFEIPGEGEVVGYKMQGEKAYRADSLVENIDGATDDEFVERYDYVLTKHAKSNFESVDTLTVKNYVRAVVDPIDQADDDAYAQSNMSWLWRRPEFLGTGGSFMLWDYGLDSADMIVESDSQIRNYGLTEFQTERADSIDNLKYWIEFIGYPYPWTADGPITDPASYGKKNVTYTVTSEDVTINENTQALSKDDFEYTDLEFRFFINDADFDEDAQAFSGKPAVFKNTDTVDFYAKFNDSSDYVKVGTYNLKSRTFTESGDYLTKSSSAKISFKPGCTDWKVVTSNPYYMTDVYIYPIISLKNSDFVKSETLGKDKVSVTHNAKAVLTDSAGNKAVELDRAGIDYIIGTEKEGHLIKSVDKTKNNKSKKNYTIDWNVDAYEDYIDPSAKTVKTTQVSGKFFDLLPYGGEIVSDSVKVYNENGKEVPSEHSISVNYKGSGRDLLTVEAKSAAERYSLKYQTVHSWDAIKDYGLATVNNVAYETGNETIGNGTGDDNELFGDLDPDVDSQDEKFLFNERTHNIQIVTAANLGLYKKVKAAGSDSYTYKTTVYPDSSYSYYIRFATTDDTKAKNLIVFDSLENFKTDDNKTSSWHGKLENIDLTVANELGVKPVVYYSTVANLDIDAHHDLTDSSVWKTNIDNIENAKAIAIDLRKKEDGSAFVLPEDTSMSIVLNMKSPDTASGQGDDIAYNNVYLNDTIITTDGFEMDFFSHQDYTQTLFRVVGNVELDKVARMNHENFISGIKFRLFGTSDYGTKVNAEAVSDDNGHVKFSKIEKGTYELQELGGSEDWLVDHETKTVTIESDGTVTIEGLEKEGNAYIFENDPRIHTNVIFRKKNIVGGETSGEDDSSETVDRSKNPNVSGVTYKLEGMSDYGTEVTEYFKSTVLGVVRFNNIEKGTYTLTEIEAPEEYIPNLASYELKIDETGGVTIRNPENENDEFIQEKDGNWYLFNEPYHEFSLRKRDAENTANFLSGAEFKLTGTSNYGTKVDKTVTSTMLGRATFDWLESGTYILQETKAPENHMLDPTQRLVTVDNQGNVTIEGLSDTELLTGFIIVDNHRSHEGKITITKEWNDGLTGEAADNRPEPTITISTREPEQFNGYTLTYNANGSTFNNGKSKNAVRVLSSEDQSGNITNTITEGEVKTPQGYMSGNNYMAFDKWYEDAACTTPFNLNTTWIGEDKTVYAGYTNKGGAYAVLEDDGDLIFFRSTENYSNNTTGTFEDVMGNTYTGRVFSGFEAVNSTSSPKWVRYNTSIKNVSIAESQEIRPTSCYSWFNGCLNMTSCDLTGLDTSNVANMNNMFSSCNALTSLDLSNFDTSNVTSMQYMFLGCNNLTSLDVSNFDTSKVADMRGMFQGCNALTSLDVSDFDTSKVTDMSGMFNGCLALTSLDVSNFDTSKVATMDSMFSSCRTLTSLDVSNFDTSKVTRMDGMFGSCEALTSLDLSSFNTSKVTNMQGMFNNCYALTSLDLSNFDTSKVTNMSTMFQGCRALTSLDLSNFDTSNVTSMNSMFNNCYALTSLDLSNFDTSKVANMSNMFGSCRALTSLDVSSFDTSNVTRMNGMFSGCSTLTSLDVSSFDTSKVTDMNNMFNNCEALTSLDLSNFDTSNVTDMNNMFNNCEALTSLDLSNFDTSKVTDMHNMFQGCRALTSLDLSIFDTSRVTDMGWMFSGCWAMTTIYASELWNTSSASASSYMFQGNLHLPNYNGSVVDKTNAHYDEGGYLTYKAAPSRSTLNAIRKGIKTLLGSNSKTNNALKAPATRSQGTATVTFDSGSDGAFEDGSTTNVVTYNLDYAPVEKCSHTPNVSDDGVQSGNYANNANLNDVVTIAGASSLNVELYYNGESVSWDWLSVWAGNYPSYTAASNAKSTGYVTTAMGAPNNDNKFGGSQSGTYTVNGNSLTNMGHCTLTIPGDSVTFGFKSDGSGAGKGYGYYAIVTGLNSSGNTLEPTTLILGDIASGEYKEPIASDPEYRFGSWDPDLSTVNSTTTVTAEYEENVIDKGTYDGVDWKITKDGELIIGKAGETQSFTYNTSRTENTWPWLKYKSQITSARFAGPVNGNGTHYCMFKGCSNMTSCDLTGFDTSDVTIMLGMFADCSSLTSLDLSNFDTSNVTSMASMFSGCKALTTLDVSGFNTSKVTDMSSMFSACNALTSLDVSSFDTSKVTSMDSMFYGCSALTSLDVSNFDTSKVSITRSMFAYCQSLASLDASNFDTSNVTNMTNMFGYCYALASLDVSNFDTSNVVDMSSMFNGCKALTSLDVSNFNTSKVTDMSLMFYNCNLLTSLDVSGFDTSKVTRMYLLFGGCNALTSLDVSNFDTSNVTNMDQMFGSCRALTSLDVSNFDTSKVTNMNGMFQGCSALTSLDVSNFDTSKVTNMNLMFQNCRALTTLDVSNFDTSNVTNMSNMFGNCNALTSLDLSNFDTSKVTRMSDMFSSNNALTSIALGPKSLFTVNPPKTNWTRYSLLNGMKVYDETPITNISDYDGTKPGWYKTAEADIHNEDDLYDAYISKQYSHENVEWVHVDDDTWTYTFNVYDDTAKYYAWENQMQGYQTNTGQNNPQVINGGGDFNVKSATITNNFRDQEPPTPPTPPAQPSGSLTISNTLAGDGVTDDDKNIEFEFTVTLSGHTGTENINGIVFKNGIGTVYLKDGDSVTLTGINAETEYSVEQKPVKGFVTTYEGDSHSGSITANKNSVVAATNTKQAKPEPPKNGFTLKKAVSGGYSFGTDEFEYRIALSNLEPNTEYTPADGITFRTNTNGEANISLTMKDGDSVTFTGLPVGSSYRITELESDYVASYKITDASGGDFRLIEKNKDKNTESNKSLSTAQEKIDEGEVITVLFTSTRDLPSPTGVKGPTKVLLVISLLMLGALALITRSVRRKKN